MFAVKYLLTKNFLKAGYMNSVKNIKNFSIVSILLMPLFIEAATAPQLGPGADIKLVNCGKYHSAVKTRACIEVMPLGGDCKTTSSSFISKNTPYLDEEQLNSADNLWALSKEDCDAVPDPAPFDGCCGG